MDSQNICFKESIEHLVKKFNIPIKEILIQDNLMYRANNLLDTLGFKSAKLLLVTDNIIYTKLNQFALFKGSIKKIILKNPEPSEEFIHEIISSCYDVDLIVACGSGTINDLCKISSYRKNISYIVFATALSMNGYTSANASITISGHKKSLAAHLPLAIYFDLNILASSPIRLTKSGIGDSLCFSTCQFDWLLSHLILDSNYNKLVFDILRPYMNLLYNHSVQDLTSKDFLELLAKILIISGFSMYVCQGSYPASQGEHLISHYLNMKYTDQINKYYHGEQISVTTMTMAKIQDQILNIDSLQITWQVINKNYIYKILTKDLASEAIGYLEKKNIAQDRVVSINNNLNQNWFKIRNKLKLVSISPKKIKMIQDDFRLVSRLKSLDNKTYNEAVNNAYLIRDRFTSLDLIRYIKK